VTLRQPIPISRIRLDGGTQPRAALDFSAIEDYSEAMVAGAKFPPVTVFYDGTDYWLADGFHRVKAAYAAEHDMIECEVHQARSKRRSGTASAPIGPMDFGEPPTTSSVQ